jgi:hypothetical protein
VDEIVLTFPDGSSVGPGELGAWLDLIDADPDIPELGKDIAHALVQRIRAQQN